MLWQRTVNCGLADMSVMAMRRIHGASVRITRPQVVQASDGSKSRAGNSGSPTELYASVKVHIASLTTERRDHVFGATSQASDTIRVPIEWGLTEGDQLNVLSGVLATKRFRIEKVIAYRTRPRISHTECALVALPAGAA